MVSLCINQYDQWQFTYDNMTGYDVAYRKGQEIELEEDNGSRYVGHIAKHPKF